jgi:hypothetical protein
MLHAAGWFYLGKEGEGHLRKRKGYPPSLLAFMPLLGYVWVLDISGSYPNSSLG